MKVPEFIIPIKNLAYSLSENGMSIEAIAKKLGRYPMAIKFWLEEVAIYKAAVAWPDSVDDLDWSPYAPLRKAA